MSTPDMTKGDRVKLTTDVSTLAHEYKAGDTFKVLGFQGSLVRLSRESDKAKLTTLPDYLAPVPFVRWG